MIYQSNLNQTQLTRPVGILILTGMTVSLFQALVLGKNHDIVKKKSKKIIPEYKIIH